MSPELIAPQRFGFDASRPTKSSDCYAFGMVIYETISGHLPFHKHTDLTVFVKVLEGERPLREVGFTDGLWEMLELCWTPLPDARPNIKHVLHRLESSSRIREPPSPELSNREVDEGSSWDSESDPSGIFSPLLCNSWSQCIPFARPVFILIQRQRTTNSHIHPSGWTSSPLPHRLPTLLTPLPCNHTYTQH